MNPFRFILLLFTWPFVPGFWWSEERLTRGADAYYASNLARQTRAHYILNNGMYEPEMSYARLAFVVDLAVIAAFVILIGVKILGSLWVF